MGDKSRKQMRLQEFIDKYKVTMDCQWIVSRPDKSEIQGNHYRITIKSNKKRMTVYYSQGFGITHTPQLLDVLDCILCDASYSDYEFSEFCKDLGYCDDSMSALKIYNLCKKNGEKIRKLFGAAMEDIQSWEVD